MPNLISAYLVTVIELREGLGNVCINVSDKKNKPGHAECGNFTGRRYVALTVKKMGSRMRERTSGTAAN